MAGEEYGRSRRRSSMGVAQAVSAASGRPTRGRQSSGTLKPEPQDLEPAEEAVEEQQEAEAEGLRKSRRISSAKVAAEAAAAAPKPPPAKEDKDKRRRQKPRPAVSFAPDIDFDLEPEPWIPEETVVRLPLQEPSKHLVDSSPAWLQELLNGQKEAAYPYKGIESDVADPVGNALGAYMILRAFSWQLRLSPFTFDDLAEALNRQTPTPLIDEVHISLLRVIYLDDTPEERAMRYPDPALLDRLTWPEYLWDHLSQLGSKLINLSCAKFPVSTSADAKDEAPQEKKAAGQQEDKSTGDGDSILKMNGAWREGMRLPAQVDYYSLPAASKAAILALMCNMILQTKAIKSELSSRMDKGQWVAGEGGVGGAFAMFTPEVRAAKAAAEEDDDIANANQFNDDYCALCRIGGGLLCCDGCPASYHLRCIGESSRSVPEGEWLCPECAMGGRHEAAGLRVPSLGTDPQGNPLWVAHGRMWGGAKGLSLAVDRANGMDVDAQLDEPGLSPDRMYPDAGQRGKDGNSRLQKARGRSVAKSRAALRSWSVDQSVRMFAAEGDTACALARQVTEPSLADEAAVARRNSNCRKEESDSEESDEESKDERTPGRRARVPTRRLQEAGSEDEEDRDSSAGDECYTDDSDYSDSDSSSDSSEEDDEGTAPHHSSLELLAKDRATPVQPEKYVNRYRNGWIALHAAQKGVLDEARKAKAEPPEGLPTPLAISRFVWSQRGRRQAAQLNADTSTEVPNAHIQAMAGCLLRMERDLLGLLEGGWAVPGAEGAAYRYGWRQRMRDAKTALELKQGALELEAATKWSTMEPQWRYQGFKSRTHESHDRLVQRAAAARAAGSAEGAQAGAEPPRQLPKDRFTGDPAATIQSKRRCFKCTTCANPSWKKACMTPIIKFMDGHIEWQGVTIQEATNPSQPSSSKPQREEGQAPTGDVSAPAGPATATQGLPVPVEPQASAAPSGQPQAPVVKRGPGRPRKNPPPTPATGDEPPKKRGPGRPRKHPLPATTRPAPTTPATVPGSNAHLQALTMATPSTTSADLQALPEPAVPALEVRGFEPQGMKAKQVDGANPGMQLYGAVAPVAEKQPGCPPDEAISGQAGAKAKQPVEPAVGEKAPEPRTAGASQSAVLPLLDAATAANGLEAEGAEEAHHPEKTTAAAALSAAEGHPAGALKVDAKHEVTKPVQAEVTVATWPSAPAPNEMEADVLLGQPGQLATVPPHQAAEPPVMLPEAPKVEELPAVTRKDEPAPAMAEGNGTAKEPNQAEHAASVAAGAPLSVPMISTTQASSGPSAVPKQKAPAEAPATAPAMPEEMPGTKASETAPAAPEQTPSVCRATDPATGVALQSTETEVSMDPGRVKTLANFFETVASSQAKSDGPGALPITDPAAQLSSMAFGLTAASGQANRPQPTVGGRDHPITEDNRDAWLMRKMMNSAPAPHENVYEQGQEIDSKAFMFESHIDGSDEAKDCHPVGSYQPGCVSHPGLTAEQSAEGSARVLRDRQVRKCAGGVMEQDEAGVWRLQVPRSVSRALVKTGIWASKASDTDLTSLPPEVLKKMEDIFNKSGDRRWAVRRIMRTGILAGQEVEYRRDRAARAILEGVMTEDGKVQCFCPTCEGKQNVSCLEFEEHAGIANRTPVDYIYLKLYNMSIREFCYQAIDEDPPPIKLPGRPRPPGQPRTDPGPSRPPGAPEKVTREASGLRPRRAQGANEDDGAGEQLGDQDAEEEEEDEEEDYFSSDEDEQEDEEALVPDWRPGGRRMGHWWRERQPPELSNWMVHRDAFTRAAGEFSLPRALTKRLARQGGTAPVNGIVYRRVRKGRMLERSPVLAWRAAMEAATSISQVALGIRELEAYIKWDCIRRPDKTQGHPLLAIKVEGKRPSEKGRGYEYQLLIPPPLPRPTPPPAPATVLPAQATLLPAPARDSLAPMGLSMTPSQLAQLAQFGKVQAVAPAMAAAGFGMTDNPLAAVMSAIAAAAAANGISLPNHSVAVPPFHGPTAAMMPRPGLAYNPMPPASAAFSGVIHPRMGPAVAGERQMTGIPASLPVAAALPSGAATGDLLAGIPAAPRSSEALPLAAASGGVATGIPAAPSASEALPSAAASGGLTTGILASPPAAAGGRPAARVTSSPPATAELSHAAVSRVPGALLTPVCAPAASSAAQAAVSAPASSGVAVPTNPGSAAGSIAPSPSQTTAAPQRPSAQAAPSASGAGASAQPAAGASSGAAADSAVNEAAQQSPAEVEEAKTPAVPKEQMFTYTNSMEEVSIRIQYGVPTWVNERRLPLWMVRVYEDAIRRKEMKAWQDRQRSARPAGTPMPFMELPEVADLCKVCSKPWDEMVTDSFWITCDRCDSGYHGPCVGVSQEQAQEMGDDARWECPSCVSHKAERRAVALAKARERRLAIGNVPHVAVTASPGEANLTPETLRRKQAIRPDDVDDEEESEAAQAASGPAVYCICRAPEDGRGMVGCDGCDEWFHPTCVGVTFEEVEQMDTFLCPLCARKEAKRANKRNKGQGAASVAPLPLEDEMGNKFTVRFNLPKKSKKHRKERKGGRRHRQGRPLVELTDEESKLLKAQLRKAHTILKSIMKLKSAFVFSEPVPLEIPYYHEMIKHPMDLGTICNRLEERGHYRSPFQVLKDIQLVWSNCRQFNMPDSDIWKAANVVEATLDKQWGSTGLPVKEHPKIKKLIKQEKLAAMGILPGPPRPAEPEYEEDEETPAAERRAARRAIKSGAETDPGPARKRSRRAQASLEPEEDERKSSRRVGRRHYDEPKEEQSEEDEEQQIPQLPEITRPAPPFTFTVPRRPRGKRTFRPVARRFALPTPEEATPSRKGGRGGRGTHPEDTERIAEPEAIDQEKEELIKPTPSRQRKARSTPTPRKAQGVEQATAPPSARKGRGSLSADSDNGSVPLSKKGRETAKAFKTEATKPHQQVDDEAAVPAGSAKKGRVTFRSPSAPHKAKAPSAADTTDIDTSSSKIRIRSISTVEDTSADSQQKTLTPSGSRTKGKTPAKTAKPVPGGAEVSAAPAAGSRRSKKSSRSDAGSPSPTEDPANDEPKQLAPPPLYSVAVVGALLEVDRDSDGQYYRCQVLRVHRDWSINVQYEDGKKECDIPMARVRPLNDPRAAVGAKVECYWELDDAYYPGTVTFVYSDGSLDVSYDDGDEDKRFPLAQTRLAAGSKKVKLRVASPPASPPPVRAPGSKGSGKRKRTA